MAASVREHDPVIFLEAKALYASKMDVPDGEIVEHTRLGEGPSRRPRTQRLRAGAMVPKALAAAGRTFERRY